jgi:hypothetical protein
MSHIVIHDDVENITQYREFDDVQAAAGYLEELHNRDGITGARLFELDEVEFAVTSYVKVEIGVSAPVSPITAPESVVYTQAAPVESVDEPDATEAVEYVEAAAAEAFAPVPAAPVPISAEEPVGDGEVRRGLFGR